MNKGSICHSVKRWFDMVWLGAVSAAIWILCSPIIDHDPVKPMLQFFLHSSGLTLLALAILTIALIIGFGKERYQAFFGVQHFFRYPPLWIAMLTGLFVLLMADQTTLPLYPDPKLLVALAIFIATTIPFLICNASICNVNQSSEHEPHKAKQERLYNFDDIKKWAEDDKEILTPDDDRFDHKITAQRIAERLIKKETASIAVIGPLGSGKSTLGKLVEYQLKPQPKMIFVQLSLWPYATVDAAVTGVIDTLIKALAKHVNVLALHSLPSDYVASIENADGILGSLVRLFKRSDQPEDVLERLGEIIGATRLKVVLWIEDLERFSGTAQLSHEQAIQREAELLGPLRSLLYLLDASPSISVVIADTNLSSRFDIDKIARFIERPPRVKKEVFVRLLAEVRNRCLNDWPIQTIQLRVPETNGIHDINKTLNINNATVDAIYELINTPRQLKHLLRIVIETWDKLPGEINFDSMLYATTLRLACPDVFALLDKYSPAMTRRTTNDQGAGGLGVLYSSLRTDQSIEDYYADLNQHLNNLGNKTQKEKTITILNVLTPFTFTQDKKDSRSSPDKKPKPLVVSDVMSPAYEDTPQSLFSSSPTDYWGRYLSMSDIDDEESDQKLLKKIDAWKSDAPKELIDAIFVQGSAAQIEYLYPFFTPTELTELLLSAAREHTDPRYGQTDLKEVGTLRVLEMLYRATTSQENSISDLRCDAIIECVNIVIPQHIDLAKGICIRAFRTGGQAFTPEKEQEFIASICQNLTETYPNDQNTVDNFLKAIGKACPQISSVQIP